MFCFVLFCFVLFCFSCLQVYFPFRATNYLATGVYIIALHAVQFGNNWMKNIPKTAKIGQGCRPSPIWQWHAFRDFWVGNIIGGFRAKGAYIAFWADFYFLQD